MSLMLFWMFGITLSTALMIAVVAFEARFVQFSLAFVFVGFIVLAGLRDQRMLQELRAYPSHITASMVRHMGIVYGWAAAMIALLYMTLLEWPHWFAAFFVMCAGATLCLFLANIIMRDLTEEAVDRRMSQLVRLIAKAQFGVTCLIFGGLVTVGGKAAGADAWAGVNLMLAAAIGLAAQSAIIMFFPAGFDFNDDLDAVAAPPIAPSRRKQDLGAPATGERRKQNRGFARPKTA